MLTWKKHPLHFRFDARTSRGPIKVHTAYYVVLHHGGLTGIGECSPLKGLSPDDRPDFEQALDRFCWVFSQIPPHDWRPATDPLFAGWPSIRFAFETAQADWLNGGQRLITDTPFFSREEPIPINGLIWMNEPEQMMRQGEEKWAAGFRCIKLKVGALDFQQELAVLRHLRTLGGPEELTLRLDANGAFSPEQALDRLEALAEWGIHSIEQPIRQGQWEQMRGLCKHSPIPIALDEELIGIEEPARRAELLEAIAPPYIILKPTLLGGLQATKDWIALAGERGIDWWITSALESNIGLNAICQLTSTFPPGGRLHGLGTGQLYSNNPASPLEVQAGTIRYRTGGTWELEALVENNGKTDYPNEF